MADPAFSDERRATLVFPELAVGNAYDEVRVSLDMAREMLVQHKSHGLQEQVGEKGGRRQISWTWRNPQPQREERRNDSVWSWGEAHYYALSSFSSHQEIAQRYDERARPRSQPTAAVRGIDSHAVLVNAGHGYALAPVPFASQLNHVISDVPAVGLFLDATAKNIPYGRLPISVEAKPVLAASSARSTKSSSRSLTTCASNCCTARTARRAQPHWPRAAGPASRRS